MQRQQSKKAPKKQSQRAVSRKQSLKAPKSNLNYSQPSRNSTIPAGYGSRFSSKYYSTRYPDHDLITGTDLLGLVSGTAAASHAATTFRVPCNPFFWTNTRVATEATRFGVYTPKEITLHWQPVVGTTTAGGIIMGTLSVSNDISGAFTPNALLASRGGVVSAVWQPTECSMDLSGLTQKAYHLNDISEDGIPLVTYLTVPEGLANAGYLWVSYVFEFRMPIALQAESAKFALTPTDLTLTNASIACTLADAGGMTIGEHGVLTANGNALSTYQAYAEVGMTNAVVDFGRLGLRQDYIAPAIATTINLLEGNVALFGKSGLVVSVYTSRAVGGSY